MEDCGEETELRVWVGIRLDVSQQCARGAKEAHGTESYNHGIIIES